MNQEDLKQLMRNYIFDIVEFINSYELSDTAQKLVIHYFNDSKAGSSYERAIEAIKRYTQDKFPDKSQVNQRLDKLFSELSIIADRWDSC